MSTYFTSNPSRFGACYATYDPTLTPGPPPPPLPADAGIKPSGGFPAYEYERRDRKKEKRKRREELGIQPKALEIIAAVATRQALDPEIDKQQQLEELSRELEIQGIQWQSIYLDRLIALRGLYIAEAQHQKAIAQENADVQILHNLATSEMERMHASGVAQIAQMMSEMNAALPQQAALVIAELQKIPGLLAAAQNERDGSAAPAREAQAKKDAKTATKERYRELIRAMVKKIEDMAK